MKRIIIILCLLFVASVSNAQIAVVTTATVTAGGAGATTPSFNSTGSTNIIALLEYHTSTTPTLSDNKSSTWVQIADYQYNPAASAGVRAYYCNPCNVGTGHTVTTGAHFALLSVICLSGTATGNPVDAFNGQNTTSNTTILPGSVTPTQSGDYSLVVACNFNSTAPTEPTGYTVIGKVPTATAEAGVSAYKSLAGTSTENPTITGMAAGNPQAAMIVLIKTPAAAVNNSGFFLNMLY